jgi:hypothetical protein
VVDAARDLATVELGDARRNKRSRMLAARLQERPDASFPELFGASELEAHYRFTNSESVALKKLISPHLRRSWEQRSDATCVLVVHDTTELSFPGESPREGLVFTGGRSYCHLHASLLLADERAPVVLGLAGLRPYVVQGEVWREVDGRALTPLKCGSDRWRDAAAAARADAPVGPRLVHLMDREADDYPLWAYIVKLGDGFVIRSGQPQRRTAGGGAVGGHWRTLQRYWGARSSSPRANARPFRCTPPSASQSFGDVKSSLCQRSPQQFAGMSTNTLLLRAAATRVPSFCSLLGEPSASPRTRITLVEAQLAVSRFSPAKWSHSSGADVLGAVTKSQAPPWSSTTTGAVVVCSAA